MNILKILFFVLLGFKATAGDLTIAISQVAEHPSLNKVRDGIVETLAKYDNNIKVNQFVANNDLTLSAQIATRILTSEAKLAIAIGTPSAQSLKQKIKNNIPIIFSSLTDAKTAGLMNNYEKPEAKITGVINNMQAEEYIKLIQDVLPHAKNIAVIYNISEKNSIDIINNFAKLAKKHQMELITRTINKTSEIAGAVESMQAEADCFFLIMDNTVASGASLVIQKAKYYKIPVLSSYLEAVKLGALAAVAYDEYQVGVETADLAIEIIKNNFTQIPPVKFANQKIKLIKRQVAEQFLITLNYEELQRKKYSVE